MNKKALIITIISMSIGLLLVVGFSVAFFSAKVFGNENANNTVIETVTLRIIFTDTEVLSMDGIIPGQAVTKTFTVENRGDVEIEYTIDIANLTNTFVNKELVYSLTSTNGGATATRKAIPTTSGTLETATIAPGVTQTYTMTVLFKETGSNQNSNMGAIFGGVLQINSNGQYTTPLPTLTEKILADNNEQSDAGISFGSTSAADGTNGLYYTSDTSKTENGEVVYYYRGAVTNNYVVFGNYCWRIVRTVEDGSVRLRYGGTPTQNGETYTCPQTGTAVSIASSQVYNEDYDDKSYVNYKTSDIRTVVENWYRDNIWKNGQNTKVTNLIADTPYCNDMSERVDSYGDISFGALDRLDAIYPSPQYKCLSSTYGYTVAKGDLTYPVGLLTADEVAYAGGVVSKGNTSYYLYTGEAYWTMSPFFFNTVYATVIYVASDEVLDGHLAHDYVDEPYAVVPAVSLKPEATVKRGTGAYNDPYVINTD